MHPISRYPVPEINDLPQDIKDQILTVQQKAGFIPNVFLALAHRPEEFRAFFAYHDALMLRDSGLTIADKEMIVVATSGANSCQYCVIAHGAVLRIRAKNPLIADQVAVNYKKADITPRQLAMLDFAMKVSQDSGNVEAEDFEALKAQGFSDDDIWDIAGITAFFSLSNRMASFLAMRPNDEFYAMHGSTVKSSWARTVSASDRENTRKEHSHGRQLLLLRSGWAGAAFHDQPAQDR